jgi:anti-sigma factor RsiW
MSSGKPRPSTEGEQHPQQVGVIDAAVEVHITAACAIVVHEVRALQRDDIPPACSRGVPVQPAMGFAATWSVGTAQ